MSGGVIPDPPHRTLFFMDFHFPRNPVNRALEPDIDECSLDGEGFGALLMK